VLDNMDWRYLDLTWARGMWMLLDSEWDVAAEGKCTLEDVSPVCDGGHDRGGV
jgi:hypothetical protein